MSARTHRDSARNPARQHSAGVDRPLLHGLEAHFAGSAAWLVLKRKAAEAVMLEQVMRLHTGRELSSGVRGAVACLPAWQEANGGVSGWRQQRS